MNRRILEFFAEPLLVRVLLDSWAKSSKSSTRRVSSKKQSELARLELEVKDLHERLKALHELIESTKRGT